MQGDRLRDELPHELGRHWPDVCFNGPQPSRRFPVQAAPLPVPTSLPEVARLADFSASPTLGTRAVRENVGHACHQLPLFHSDAPMKFTEKLSLWGVAHAAARNAERAAAQQAGEPSDNLHREARILRERADRLHREVYMELGPRRADQAGRNP
jgi:hypothetical protein